jgi:hypothetical protein
MLAGSDGSTYSAAALANGLSRVCRRGGMVVAFASSLSVDPLHLAQVGSESSSL